MPVKPAEPKAQPSVIGRVQPLLPKLKLATAKLNSQSDKLNKSAETLNTALKKMGVGVGGFAWPARRCPHSAGDWSRRRSAGGCLEALRAGGDGGVRNGCGCRERSGATLLRASWLYASARREPAPVPPDRYCPPTSRVTLKYFPSVTDPSCGVPGKTGSDNEQLFADYNPFVEALAGNGVGKKIEPAAASNPTLTARRE
jgi:hypothetical protein